MVEINKPKEIVEEKYSLWNWIKLIFLLLLKVVLGILLLVTCIQLIYAFIHFIRAEGVLSDNSLKYGLIILAGTYIALFIDGKKIKDFLNIEDVEKLIIEDKKNE